MSQKKYTVWILLGIVLLATTLRFYQIAKPSYWLDEMVSVNIATHFDSSSLFWDNHPILYHGLLRAWVSVTDPFELSTRSLSAIFSLLTTLSLGLWGRRKFGDQAGLLLAGLHAIHPMVFQFAQETRMYSLFELTATLQMICFWENFQNNKKARLWLPITTVLLCYTHYAALAILIVQSAYYFTQRKPSLNDYWWVFAGLGSLCIYLSYSQNFSWYHLEWQKLKFSFEWQARFPHEAMKWVAGGSWPMLAAFLFCVGLQIPQIKGRDSFKLTHDQQLLRFGLTMIASCFFLITAFAWASQRSLFLNRYFIFLIPYALLATVLFWKIWPKELKRFSMPFIALTLISSLWVLSQQYTVTKAPWRQVSEKIRAENPDTVIYTTRTLAIRAPYFETYQIPVKRLETKLGLDSQLKEDLDRYSTVWILENFFGGLTYLDQLQLTLQAEGYESKKEAISVDSSEPIFVLKISKKMPTELPKKAPKNKPNAKPESETE